MNRNGNSQASLKSLNQKQFETCCQLNYSLISTSRKSWNDTPDLANWDNWDKYFKTNTLQKYIRNSLSRTRLSSFSIEYAFSVCYYRNHLGTPTSLTQFFVSTHDRVYNIFSAGNDSFSTIFPALKHQLQLSDFVAIIIVIILSL